MIPEDAIRNRSYLIWQREGCQDGKAVEHWERAKAELEAEYKVSTSPSNLSRRMIEARPPISRRPHRTVSGHVPASERKASTAAATENGVEADAIPS